MSNLWDEFDGNYDGQGKTREQEVASTLRMLFLVLVGLGIFWGFILFLFIVWIT